MLSNTVNSLPNLNPFDPQLMIARYVTMATLAVFVWELLNNILNDYKLLSKHRICLPTVVYFISRLCTLGYILSTAVLKTLVDSCYWLGKISSVFFFLCVPSTSLLFFFRTRAVFDRNPWIIAFFLGLWLGVVATCVLVLLGVNGTNIGPTKYCMDEVKTFVMFAAVIPMINDTLVFLAITWRLYNNSYASPTLRDGFQVLIFGDYLPRFSRAMLQDGQAYYLTTIAINLVAVIMIFIDSLPGILRTLVWIPNVILMNIMACRVFRNTKFGSFRETEIATSFILREQTAEVISPESPPLWEVESGHTMQQAGEGKPGHLPVVEK